MAEKIYNETGVIITDQLFLYSKCGYVSLEAEMEFKYIEGCDRTDYCEINTISEMSEYIKNMNCYEEVLTDLKWGKFTKAELYWSVKKRVLCQKDNFNENGEQDWSFTAISQHKNNIELNGSLIPCAPVEILIAIDSSTTIGEALESFVAELNKETNYQDWLVPQKVYSCAVVIPETYDMLLEYTFSDGLN